MELTKLSKLKTNPKNPRTITDAQFERLKDSLLVFPKMLTLRPLATDGNGIVLGGNMRLRALKDIAKMTAEQIAERLQGMKTYNQKSEAEQNALVEYWRDWLTRKDVPTTHESTLTDAEKDEFVMTDNASFGSWDFDAIANEWDAELVEEWGVDVWQDDVSEDEQGNENDYDNEDDNELKDENVETMLNDATTLVANDLIKQFDTLQGFTFITPNTAKFDFIRFAYYGKEYPRYNSLAFHTKQFITAGDKFSTYEGLNKVSRGEIKAERLRFVCQDKFRAIISGSLAFCGAKMPLDFPAELARDLIDEFSNGGKVLDPCAGWGGRMVGFLASNATYYDGTDASPYQCEGVQKIYDTFKDVAKGKNKNASITCLPFEKRELKKNAFDMAITSPPYFDREKYIGGEQSRETHNNYDDWRENFYAVLIAMVYDALKKGGVFCLQVGSQFYPLLEDGKTIAQRVGFVVESVRATNMINNQTNTEKDDAEVILILRKKK